MNPGDDALAVLLAWICASLTTLAIAIVWSWVEDLLDE